jgi:Ca2+:H+ antiporter
VLLAVFLLTLPGFLQALPGEMAHERPRWSLVTILAVLGLTATAAALVSDWFVDALRPAIEILHMSDSFAGLIVVAIAGNAVENLSPPNSRHATSRTSRSP